MRQLTKYSLAFSLLLPGVFLGTAIPLAGSELGKRASSVPNAESRWALGDFALRVLDLPPQPRKFDEFGDINCEDEMARLDSLALQLNNEPMTTAVIVFYGGRQFRGRSPRQGEAAARAARLKPYLVQRRGIPSNRVGVIDGGYKEEFKIELWLIPAGATSAVADQTNNIPAKDIKFQKGKATARQFKCEI